MGGPGSGNWFRWQERKSTVEESLVVAVRDLRDRIRPREAGTLTWTSLSGSKSSVRYFVTWGDRPTLTLHYRWQEHEDVRIPIWLQTTPTHFGGERWWFTCPLVVGNVACNRRVGKLFLPPGAKYFGCRKCHNLTYRSCQEAHQSERLLAHLEHVAGIDSRLATMISRLQ